MRAVLSLLLCFVLLESQALAAHTRGPGGIATNVVGTYAGVLLPDTTAAVAGAAADNTLAVFNLSVPSTGLSTGAFLAFSNGRVFNGTINGIGDPDVGSILAVLQATFNFTLEETTTGTNGQLQVVSVPITATLTGNMKATVAQAELGSTSLGRLTGTAHLDVNFGAVSRVDFAPIISDTIDFIVDGFKQSDTATTSTGG